MEPARMHIVGPALETRIQIVKFRRHRLWSVYRNLRHVSSWRWSSVLGSRLVGPS